MRIRYEPFEEIIIKDYTYFKKVGDLVDIVAGLRGQGELASLNWASGVVFIYSEIPPVTAPIAEDLRQGKVYWINVSFAYMTDYKSQLKSSENVPVPVINQDSNYIMKEVAKWLGSLSP
jgi:hypothetical protein